MIKDGGIFGGKSYNSIARFGADFLRGKCYSLWTYLREDKRLRTLLEALEEGKSGRIMLVIRSRSK